MNESTIARERLAWTAVVTVLVTSIAWLAIIALGLLLGVGHDPRIAVVWVVSKAIARASLALVAGAGPLAALALLVAALLFGLVHEPRSNGPVRAGARHA